MRHPLIHGCWNGIILVLHWFSMSWKWSLLPHLSNIVLVKRSFLLSCSRIYIFNVSETAGVPTTPISLLTSKSSFRFEYSLNFNASAILPLAPSSPMSLKVRPSVCGPLLHQESSTMVRAELSPRNWEVPIVRRMYVVCVLTFGINYDF